LISIPIHILTAPLIDLLRHFLHFSISITCISWANCCRVCGRSGRRRVVFM